MHAAFKLTLLLVLGCCLLRAHAQAGGGTCANTIPPLELDQPEGQPTPPMAYCIRTIGATRVLWLHGGVGEGSASNVLIGLRQTQRYDEVWLNSPGGSVNEAIEIGRELRRRRALVRVPAHSKVYCVSACTILMLGGYNRTVDRNATFIVHAKSAMMDVRSAAAFRGRKDRSWGDAVVAFKQEPKLIAQLAQNMADGEAERTTELVSYYQTMIEGTPAMSEYRRVAAAAVPKIYTGTTPIRRFSDDAADVDSRGVVALQELFTQVELSTMAALHDALWQQRGVLGRGAEEALKIFRAGLNCRIQDLCPLERHQLEQLGYHNFTPQ